MSRAIIALALAVACAVVALNAAQMAADLDSPWSAILTAIVIPGGTAALALALYGALTR